MNVFIIILGFFFSVFSDFDFCCYLLRRSFDLEVKTIDAVGVLLIGANRGFFISFFFLPSGNALFLDGQKKYAKKGRLRQNP